MEVSPLQSQSPPGHSSEHLVSKDVTIFPFAGSVHQLDEHSWRYRPTAELSTTLSSSVADLESVSASRRISLVEPNLVSDLPHRNSQVFPAHPHKPRLSLYNRTSSFLSNGGSIDLSMSMTIDRVGSLSDHSSSSNLDNSFHESSAFAIANGPYRTSERMVLVQSTSSRR